MESARSYKKGDNDKSPSNRLTTQLIRWFSEEGGTARRVNTMGQYDMKIGRYRPSGMRKGFEDIDAIYPVIINGIKIGVKIACEIKIGKDKLSEDQITRQKEVEAAGGIYIVCKTMEQSIIDIHNAIADLYKKLHQSFG